MTPSVKTPILSLIFSLSLFSFANKGFALVHGDVMIGKKWYDLEPSTGSKTGFSAQTIDASGHIDPIPLLPIALGLYLSSVSPTVGDLQASSASLLQIGLDLEAWIPIVPFFTPYGRFRFPISGDLSVSSNVPNGKGGEATSEVKYKVTGPTLQLGAKFAVLPLIKLLAQVGRGIESYSVSSYTLDGVKQTETSDGKLSSNSFMLGIEIGF